MFQSLMIGNDHGGYDAKQTVLPFLKERAIDVTDIGCQSTEIVRYPHYARAVAQAVADGRVDGGILICSTGIGMSIAANRVPGVRASLCTSHYMAMMTRRHNNSNILCLGGRTTGPFELLDILEAWLTHDYEGGRHDISLGLIRDFDEGKTPRELPAHPLA